jgi:hypothetical protein
MSTSFLQSNIKDSAWEFTEKDILYRVDLVCQKQLVKKEDNILYLSKAKKERLIEMYHIAMDKLFYSTLHKRVDTDATLAYIGYRFDKSICAYKIDAINPHNSVIMALQSTSESIAKEINKLSNLPDTFNAEDIKRNIDFLQIKNKENQEKLEEELNRSSLCKERFNDARKRVQSLNHSLYINIMDISTI